MTHAESRPRTEFWRFNEHVARRDIRETRCLPLLERVQQIDALNSGLAFMSEVARAKPQIGERLRAGIENPDGV